MLLERLVLLSVKDSSICSSKFLAVLHVQHENLSFGLRRIEWAQDLLRRVRQGVMGYCSTQFC